jgi:hypothetical protein
VRDRSATLKLFAGLLKVELREEVLAGPAKDELKKLGDDWNREVEQRFRAERASVVEEIEQARQIKKMVAPEGTGDL